MTTIKLRCSLPRHAETPEEQISVLNGIAAHGSVTAANRAASETKAVLNERGSATPLKA